MLFICRPWHGDVGPKKDTYNLGKLFKLCLTCKRLRCIYQLSWWSGYNPQFKLVVNVPENKTAAVWLLMSKHITVTEQKNTDFITLHVYNDTNGERVYHHGKALKEGTYVNSPHILVIVSSCYRRDEWMYYGILHISIHVDSLQCAIGNIDLYHRLFAARKAQDTLFLIEGFFIFIIPINRSPADIPYWTKGNHLSTLFCTFACRRLPALVTDIWSVDRSIQWRQCIQC
jgi:hypothetical protein